MMATKKMLRSEMRAALKKIPPSQFHDAGMLIAPAFFTFLTAYLDTVRDTAPNTNSDTNNTTTRKTYNIALFASLPTEIDLQPIDDGLRFLQRSYPIQRLLPLVVHHSDVDVMQMHKIPTHISLRDTVEDRKSTLGIRQANADWPVVPVHDVDLVLVPTLAVSDEGYRLGKGKGHYDRWLAALHTPKHAPEHAPDPTACESMPPERAGSPCKRPCLIATVMPQQCLFALPCEKHDVPMDATLSPHLGLRWHRPAFSPFL